MLKCLNVKMPQGFSLAELLIAMAVVLILSLIIFPYYRTAQQQLSLQRSANKLAQDIRRAQEMAMAAEVVGGAIPTGGYGIYLTTLPSPKTSYILFADQNNNHKYNPGGGLGEFIEEIPLESGVKIQNVAENHLHIIFSPPDPTTSFSGENGNDLDATQVGFTVSSIDETKTKTITVNKAGLINVE